jgi:hypothetical protein
MSRGVPWSRDTRGAEARHMEHEGATRKTQARDTREGSG